MNKVVFSILLNIILAIIVSITISQISNKVIKQKETVVSDGISENINNFENFINDELSLSFSEIEAFTSRIDTKSDNFSKYIESMFSASITKSP